MSLPKWNDPDLKAGTMIRTAIWLVTEIGVGNTFTKEIHRGAFVGIAQADRRLRDLRAYGWIIHTSAEDVTLNSNEQRFVAAGVKVWERGERKRTAESKLTAKMRKAVFADNDYQCTVCGIAGGEEYPDGHRTSAVLFVSRRRVILPTGQLSDAFTTECSRCRAGGAQGTIDIAAFFKRVSELGCAERAVFIRWAEDGRRSALDRVWAMYRQLPTDMRDDIHRQLIRG